MTLVLDSSVVIAWLMPDEHSELAEAAAYHAMVEGADVPALLGYEVANALTMNARRRRIDVMTVPGRLDRLADLGLRTEPYPTADILHTIAELAALYGLSVYDAAYLELARRLRTQLATLDGPLQDAARLAGVPLFTT